FRLGLIHREIERKQLGRNFTIFFPYLCKSARLADAFDKINPPPLSGNEESQGLRSGTAMFLVLVALIFLGSVESSKKSSLPKSAINSGQFGFTGCPTNNDFYYNGIISSPYYPKLYPPNTECYYYMTAEPGKVSEAPNATVTTPDKLYTTTQRFALVTFQSDPVVQKTGFQFVYQSVFSECHSSGLAETFNVDADYAVIWTAEDLASNQLLSETVLGLTEDVPDVLQNNNTNLQCIFKYAQGAVSFEAKENKEREGVEKVVIAFVPQNPSGDQDFYEAMEFAHTTRTTDDTKVIVIAMGKDLDVARLSLLSYGSGFTFHADYDGLRDLVPAVNGALCEQQSTFL
ncbi:CUB domain protein, partial [Ostertagia ostertagi]